VPILPHQLAHGCTRPDPRQQLIVFFAQHARGDGNRAASPPPERLLTKAYVGIP
jgi:hypothetical protein